MAEQIKGIILMFIGVIVALPLLLSMVSIINPQTELSSVTDEEINISPAYYDSNGSVNESLVFTLDYGYETTGNTPISSFVLGNSTTDATETTDYVINESYGTFTLKNSSFWLNSEQTAYADYDYKASSYMENSFARLLTALIIGIASLVILVSLVAWVVKLFSY